MDDALSTLASRPSLPVVVAVLLAIGLLVGVLVYRRRMHVAAGPRRWRVQLQAVCDDAGSAVDELLPQRNVRELPATAVLTAVVKRLRLLEGPLAQIVQEAPPRFGEAAEDIGQVALALRTALQAERTGRVSRTSGEASRAASMHLVVERTAELDMAIREARRLINVG